MKTGWGMVLVVGAISGLVGGVIAAPADAERAALVVLNMTAL